MKREYYLENRKKILEQRREYYLKNREAVRERQAAYRNSPGKREAQQQRAADWYRVNGEKTRARAARWQRVNVEKARAGTMFRRHGMRPEDWAALWEAQDGKCYLCGDEMDCESRPSQRGVHVEHDHSCCGMYGSCPVCRRGLACADCNAVIGYAHEDPARLRRIADALEAAQAAFGERKALSAAGQLQLFPGSAVS